MTQLKLNQSELVLNKVPRMPVCIVVDTSENVICDAVNIRNIKRGLEQLTGKIKDSLSLRTLIDLCIISYGSKVKVTKPFGSLKEDETIQIDVVGGLPDLNQALRQLIQEYTIRMNEYDANGINRYTPTFFIISSGELLDKESAEVSQICHWSSIGKVEVVPIKIGEGTEDSLSMLSLEGNVFQMNSFNYESLFDTIGKSIEMLSQSSYGAVESLKAKSVAWDEFERK